MSSPPKIEIRRTSAKERKNIRSNDTYHRNYFRILSIPELNGELTKLGITNCYSLSRSEKIKLLWQAYGISKENGYYNVNGVFIPRRT